MENIAIYTFLAALIAIAVPIPQSMDRNEATKIENPSVGTRLVGKAFGLILFGAVLRPTWSNGLLESRWLARAGRIAYPWYLTHVLVLHWAWGELMLRAPGIETLSRAAQLALFLPIYLAGSILAALVLHFLVEKPCLLLKDSIGRPRRARKPAFTTQTA